MAIGVSAVREALRESTSDMEGTFGVLMFILGYALLCAAWIFGG
jgi:hypothetical protein